MDCLRLVRTAGRRFLPSPTDRASFAHWADD
jgi:hypothetical protein